MLMPDLKTEAGRAEWDKRRAENLESLIEDLRAEKAKGSSPSKWPHRFSRFDNANPGGGGL